MVEPLSGEHFFWEFSHLDSVCFEAFLAHFSRQYPDEIHIIQLDNSRAHTACSISLPENIRLWFQPPYCEGLSPESNSGACKPRPELNPIERLWRFIKDRLAWQLWTDLEELISEIEFHLRQLTQPIVASITAYDSILDALFVSGIF